jgi:hypothetical protein
MPSDKILLKLSMPHPLKLDRNGFPVCACRLNRACHGARLCVKSRNIDRCVSNVFHSKRSFSIDGANLGKRGLNAKV